MEIRFNKSGSERKELVAAISEVTGWEAIYQKAPTFAYVIRNYTIDKKGTLIYDERTGADDVSGLLAELAERGFIPDVAPGLDATAEEGISGEEASAESIHEADAFGGDSDTVSDGAAQEISADEASGDGTHEVCAQADGAPDTLSIEIPLSGFTDDDIDKLEKLVASKAALIRKAVGAANLPIERERDRLCFPWFSPDASPEEIKAYSQFVAALCDMAKKQRRVIAKEKPADSEKFAFRCFLLRLGFIGDEFTSARKILLANLPGDSSFKNGKRKDRAEAGAQAANAADSAADSADVSSAGEDETLANDADTRGVEGAQNSYALAEALADAELIHNVNNLFEEGGFDDGYNA